MKRIIIILMTSLILLSACSSVEEKDYNEILKNSMNHFENIDAATIAGRFNTETQQAIFDTSVSFKFSFSDLKSATDAKLMGSVTAKLVGEIFSVHVLDGELYLNILGDKVKMDFDQEELKELLDDEENSDPEFALDDFINKEEREKLLDVAYYIITEDKDYIKYSLEADSELLVLLNEKVTELLNVDSESLLSSNIIFNQLTLLIKDGTFSGMNMIVTLEDEMLMESSEFALDFLIAKLNEDVKIEYPDVNEYKDFDIFDLFKDKKPTFEDFDF